MTTIPPIIDKAGLEQLEKVLLSTSPEETATWVWVMGPAVKEVFDNVVGKHYKDTPEHHLAFGMLLGILFIKTQLSIVKGVLDGSIEIEG